jgi:hypothetical protein
MPIIFPRIDTLARSGIAAAKGMPGDLGAGIPSLLIIQSGSGAQPTCCAVGLRGLTHEGKAAGGWS